MGIKLQNLSGNGSVVPDSIASYSYSEDVTSLEPSNIAGATSQVTLNAVAIESELTDPHRDSKLLINNEMSLTDSEWGEVSFQVKNITRTPASLSVTGDTIQARLNVERRADPHGGQGATLMTALYEYCGLVDIIPVIDEAFEAELDAVPVNFMGWDSNVWEKLKELCAGFSASTTDNVGLEMVIENDNLIFRKAKQTSVNLQPLLADYSINIESFETAKSVKVFNYNTLYGVDEVFYELSNFDEGKKPEDKFQSSVSDSMQVEPGETVRKRFQVNCTFDSVNQPVPVDQITRNPPEPYEGQTGEYVVVGIDDLPIDPLQWSENGGLLRVELVDENGELLPPGEIELVITAPNFTNMPLAENQSEVAFAPYKIGVESSGEEDYPALWLTGTGVFFEKKEKLFLTGSSDEYTSRAEGPTVDNIFITDDFNVSSRGVAAAQANCGPRISISQNLPTGAAFSETIGSVQDIGLNMYRINSAAFSESGVTLNSSAYFHIADWNALWADATFQDFEDIVLDPELFPDEAFKFNEFSVMPRIR
jgi:hypothetical protein